MKKLPWVFVAVISCAAAFAFIPEAPAADSNKDFVVSQKCQACHSEEYKSWKTTFHAKIVMPRKGGVLKEAVAKWRSDGTNPGPTKGNVTGKAFNLD
ncbi:MAG TPA: multiheme c-type cytochrome, partial [Thermodesulfobacteriota bacterium]|nr:multiheme c-type cytochrome [Thermodesulfobacteriota bacterium]